MIEREYLKHLVKSMLYQKQNSINQMGKSDIEPPNYREIIDRWHSDLFKQIRTKHPSYYVKSVNVYEKSKEIVGIEYNYFKDSDKIYNTTINIFYI